MEIDKKLYKDIKSYCELNNLKVSDFINGLLRKAFNIEKYGEKPMLIKNNNEEVKFENKNTNNIVVPNIKKEDLEINVLNNTNDNSLENDAILSEKQIINKPKPKRKLN